MLQQHLPSPTGVLTPAQAAGRPAYLLAFSNDDALPRPGRQTLVRARDGAELAQLAAILGEAGEIALSEPFRERQPQLAAAAERLRAERPALAFPLDAAVLRETLRRLPLALGGLIGSGLALDDDDPLPEPIERGYVHKKSSPTS